jgi:sugar lactone lactonase YvrE
VKTLDFSRYALSSGVAAVCLAGCGGSNAIPLAFSNVGAASVVSKSAAANEGASYLYVANWGFGSGGGIDVFLRDDPSKGSINKIRDGVFDPDGIFVDMHGNLYVTNGHMSGRESVEMYANGSHKPTRIYTGALCAFDVMAASDDTVYIADACGGPHTRGRVLVYAPGKTKPSRALFPGGIPYCLTLDANNNLYVGYNSRDTLAGQVKRYPPGAKDGVNLLAPGTVAFVTSLLVDEHGALLVADEAGGVVDVFTGKDQAPARVIKTGQGHPFMLTFDRPETTLYVSDACFPPPEAKRLSSSGCRKDEKLPNTVVALDYATGKRLWTLRGGPRAPDFRPTGVAVTPSAPL